MFTNNEIFPGAVFVRSTGYGEEVKVIVQRVKGESVHYTYHRSGAPTSGTFTMTNFLSALANEGFMRQSYAPELAVSRGL